MSLVNLTLRVRQFNINISIKRTDSKNSTGAEALAKTESMIQSAIDRKESYKAQFYQLNSYLS